jgi:hypothetical protein
MRTKLKYQNLLKKIFLTCFALTFASYIFGQSEDRTYKDNGFSCNYQIKYGMLKGHYESFYKNGNKKSEGTFEYNHRIGEWSVWDSTGKLRVKRIYSNPLEYNQIVPETPFEGPIPLLDKPVYTLQRDSLDEWKYYYLAERMVAYQQRNFKCFYTSEEQLFFDCQTLFDILYSNAKKRNYAIYGSKDSNEDHTYQLRLDISTIDTSKTKLVGFRVKSDWIFDNTRFVSDERPLFITPLAINRIAPKDTFDLFSVYVPDVRKYLVQYQLAQTILPPYLHNLDDVFFFGCFVVDKWRVSKWAINPPLTKYIATAQSATNTYLLKEVETENDLWLHFNK